MAVRTGKLGALILVTILLAPAFAVSVAAGEPASSAPSSPAAPHRAFIAPSLQTLAKRSASTDLLPVTIVLSKPLAAPSSDDRAEAARARALSAERDQSDLLAFLEREASRGRASDVTSLWTVNAISAKVTPSVLKLIERRGDVEAVWKAGEARVSLESHNPLREEIIRHLSEDLRTPLLDREDHARLAALYRATPPDVAPGDILDPDWAQEWIAADLLMKRAATGAGSTLAVIDSGAWGGHPELDHAIVDFVDFTRRSSDRAHGAWAWHGHAAQDEGTLVFPVDLTDATVATVTFRSFHDFPTCYFSPESPYVDWCERAKIVAHDPVTGENELLRTLFDRADAPTTVTVDLTAWAGRTFELQFVVSSSTWVDRYDGWFVDDVALTVDGALAWFDTVEAEAGRGSPVDGWTRWNRAIYDAPVFAAGNGQTPAVVTSPVFDLAASAGPFSVNVTWFKDSSTYTPVNLWGSSDQGASWAFIGALSHPTHEDLETSVFELPEDLTGVSSLVLAFASAHGYGAGMPGASPREWPNDIGDRRGFALARVAIDGLVDSATTTFEEWLGEGGWRMRPLSSIAYDDAGHGTAVAGIIAADGSRQWHRGLAPEADLVVIKVFNREGWASEAELLAAYGHVSSLPDVDILSYSGGSFETTIASTWGDLEDHFAYPARFDFEVSGTPAHPASYLLGYVELATWDGSYAWDYQDPHPLVARFVDPTGSTYQGVPVDWVLPPGEGTYEDERVWFHKLNPETPLPSGTWSLVAELDPATHPAKRSGEGALWIGDAIAPGWPTWRETSRLARTFDLAGLETATLSFWTRYSSPLEGACGRVIVEEIGGPLTLDTLHKDYDPYYLCDDNFYNATSQEYELTGWYHGWSGDGWRQVALDLTAFAGRAVNVTFEWNYGDWSPAEGWFIDDLAIPELGHEEDFDLDLGEWQILDPTVEAQWRIVSENPFTPGMYAAVAVGYPDDGSSPQSLAIDAVAASGILPVVAAGNHGGSSDCDLLSNGNCRGLGLRTINTPAAARGAYAVGATAKRHDRVAAFSSLGPVGFGSESYLKPDVVAPGVGVRTLYGWGGFTEQTGTSFATPQVAALAALMLQADPTLRAGLPGSVTSLINATAVDIAAPGRDFESGWGRIDAYEAVNATGHLPPLKGDGSPGRSLGHELFAGTVGFPNWAQVGNNYAPDDARPMVVTDRGFNDSAVLDLRAAHIVATDETGLAAKVEFYVDRPSPGTTVLLYLDLDQDETTGERGAERVVRFTFGSDNGVEDLAIEAWQDGAWVASGGELESAVIQPKPLVLQIRSLGGAPIPAEILGSPEGLRTFRAWLEARVGDEVVDRAPNAGYGLFPTHHREVVASAFSWNQTARAPQSGEPVTFRWEAFRNLSCVACPPVLIAQETVFTDANGGARVTFDMVANRTYETHRLVVSDTHENAVTHGFTPTHVVPPVPPVTTANPTPGWRLGTHATYSTTPAVYLVDPAEGLNLSWVIMDRVNGDAYNGEAYLQIRNEWYCWSWYCQGTSYASTLLGPYPVVDGVFFVNVTYAELPQPSSVVTYDVWSLKVLGGSETPHPFVLSAGHIQGRSDGDLAMEVRPYLAAAAPGDTVDFATILNVEEVDGLLTPRGGGINVTVAWVTERDAASLLASLPAETSSRFARALLASNGDEAQQILTESDVRRIGAALRNEALGFRNFETRASYEIPATGIGTFPVHVPEGRVLVGWVGVEDLGDCRGGAYGWCNDEQAMIVIPSILARSGPHRPNVPDVGSGEPEIDAWMSWDYDPVTRMTSATATAYINVYRETDDDEVSLSGVNVWVHTALGDVLHATTDADGGAVLTFPAPVVNVTKANWHERFYDAWVVTDVIDPSNGHALATLTGAFQFAGYIEWLYFGDRPQTGTGLTTIDILGGFVEDELRSTVRWLGRDGVPATNIPSSIQAYKSTGSAYYAEGGVLHTEHVVAPTGEWPVTVKAEELGSYVVSVLSEPALLYHETRTFERTPFLVELPAFDEQYPTHATIPIPIVVRDSLGAPLAGAEVWVFLDTHQYCWIDFGDDGNGDDSLAAQNRPQGHNCVGAGDRAHHRALRAVTDENGAAMLSVQAPARGNLWTYLEIWVTTPERMARVLDWSFFTQSGAILPNLAVSLRALPSVLAVGQTTLFEAVIRNTGSAASPATILRFAQDGLTLRDVVIPALSPDAEAVVPLVWGANATGSFSLAVAVDPAGAIEEASEIDNEVASTVRVTKPNLVASTVVIPPPRATIDGVEHVNLGTAYVLRATITNVGDIPAPASTHRILAGSTVLASATDVGLAPGDTFEIVAPWTPSALGPVDLTVVADALLAIDETDEADNNAVRRVVVAEAPDLIVRTVRSAAAVRIDTPVEFEYKVTNIGGLTTGSPTVLRFTAGAMVIDTLVPTLGPGENATVIVSTSFAAPGFVSWNVVVDALGEVAEFSETNNGAAGSATVRYVNLVVSLLAPAEVWLGAPTRLKATVVNDGTWPSPPTTLDVTDLLLPDGPALANAATGVAIPELAPGRGHTVEIPAWSTNVAGVHRLEAVLPAESDDLPAGNSATREIAAETAYVRDLCIRYVNPVRPAPLEVAVVFRTNVNGQATLTATGAGPLAPVTVTRPVALGWNHAVVPVPTVSVGPAVLTFTVTVPGASATVISGESVDGCSLPAITVQAKPVIVKDSNHTVAEVSSSVVTKTLDVWTFDIATLKQEFVIDVKAGAQGRILSGLEYLRFYPNYCVEQTTSPMLAALHIIEYYKARGVYDDLDSGAKENFDQAVRGGVNILTSGHNKQKPSGGWSMYGYYGDATNFYSAFATHGLLSVRNDPTYRDLVDDSGVNYAAIPSYFASAQNANGGFSEGAFTWYLRSEVALTALILKDLAHLRPLVTAPTARATLDRVAQNATQYLFATRDGAAWPDYPNQPVNTYSTAFALWGLQSALDADILPPGDAAIAQSVIGNAVSFLESRQGLNGGWKRDADSANYYTSFLESAVHAETTAIVVLALNATGRGLENEAVVRGVNNLYGIYRDGGSFGNTRTTQAAVHALALLQRTNEIGAQVEVLVDGVEIAVVNLTTWAPDCQFGFDEAGVPQSLTPACDIEFTGGTLTGRLARMQHNVTFNVVHSTVPTLLAAYNRQHGDYDEAMATVPARYIDPIATTFFLDLAWPAESVQNQATTITASFRNEEPLSIFSPAIAVPLGTTLAAANTAADPPTMRFADGTLTSLEFQVVNGVLYLLPQYVPEASTTTFSFKVRPLVAGAVGITATGYPLYNDQLMAVASATGNVKGFGSVRVNVVDETGQPFAGATSTLGGATLDGATATFTDVLEGAKTITVSAPGRLTVTGAVDVARGATTPVKVALVPAASAPRWIYTTAASAGTALVDDVTTDETYTRLVRAAVSSTGGATTVAYTIPAGHTLRGITFAGTPVSPTVASGVAFVTLAGALDGDLVFDLESPDRIAPVVTIVAPAPDATNVLGATPLSLTFADFKGVHAASLSLTVDGANVTAAATKTPPAGLLTAVSWTPSPALAVGPHSATVSVADLAGNVATRAWSFTVVAPAPGGSTPGLPTGTPPPGTRATVALLAGGSSTTANLDSARVRSIRLTAGGSNLNDLVVDVTPRATLADTGASQPAPGFVLQYLDITVTSGGLPLSAGALEGAAIRFAVSRAWMESQRLAPAHVSLAHWTGGAWTVLATTLVSEDATTLVFEAVTSGFSPFAIVGHDGVQPTIASLRPNDGEVTSSTSVSASYSDDSAIDVSRVRLTIDGQNVPVVAGPGSLTATLSGLAQGPHTLVLSVADVHGNVATRTSRFTYSLAAASVAIESPAPGSVVESGRVAIRIALTGFAGLTNAGVRVTVDGTAVPVNVAGGLALGSIDLSEGPHALVVTATDLTGRAAQATSDFRVDLAAPALAPEVPTGPVSGVVRIPTGASDSAGVDRVEVFVDGVLVQTLRAAPWIAEIDTSILPDGTHLVSFVVYDRANRSTTRATDLDTANGADEVLGEGRGFLGLPGPGAVAWLAALGVAAALLATARSVPRRR